MKKITFVIIFWSLSVLVFAQKPTLSKAWNLFYEKNYPKAKEIIDLCVQDEKLSTKASTYLYQGNINLYLSQAEMQKKQKDSNYQSPYADAPNEAFVAFKKAIALNPKVTATDMLTPQDGLSELSMFLLIRGSQQIEQHDYENALTTLERAAECFELSDSKNEYKSEMYYYLGFTQEMLKKNIKAILSYEKSLENHPKTPDVAIRLLELYKTEKRYDDVKKILPKLETLYPNVPYFFTTKIEMEMRENKENALKMLENLPQEIYNDIQSLSLIANFYILEENYQRAEELLKRALMLAPDNFDVNYNMSVCYLNMSRIELMRVNELLLKSKDKETQNQATAIKAQALEYFVLAKQYYENSLRIQSDNPELYKLIQVIESQTEVFAK